MKRKGRCKIALLYQSVLLSCDHFTSSSRIFNPFLCVWVPIGSETSLQGSGATADPWWQCHMGHMPSSRWLHRISLHSGSPVSALVPAHFLALILQQLCPFVSSLSSLNQLFCLIQPESIFCYLQLRTVLDA